MHASLPSRIGLLLVSATSLAGCFVVEDDLLPGADGGSSGTQGAENCGDVTAPLLMPGMTVEVDTRGMTNDQSGSLCNEVWGAPASGPDAFFRLQVASGEYWHFHIEPMDAGLDPVVYVMPPNCTDSGLCSGNRSSNRCDTAAPPDEHFGVEFNQSGNWFLGIDDVGTTGGRYRVSVFRPECDDGQTDHGESCDGDVSPVQDTCSDTCHLYLPGTVGMTASGEGTVPNDDKFWAPELRVTTVLPITISGTVRGECDPDVFMVPLPAGSSKVRAELVDAGGNCIAAPTTGTLELSITDANNTYNVEGSAVGGCFFALAEGLTNGQHFVNVVGGDPTTSVVYRLKFSLPP